MRRVLVAGATGRLGAAMVAELKARGYRVRALVRDPGRLTVAPDETVVGDITNPKTLAGVCKRVDTVISCAGAPVAFHRPLRRTLSYLEVDDAGNRNLLSEALSAKVERFGYVSAFGGEWLGGVEYVRSHVSFTVALRTADIQSVVIRPTGFFPSFLPFLNMARRGRAFVIGNGHSRTNPIHVADLTRATVDALEAGTRDVPVGGPATYSRREIAEKAFVALDKRPRIIGVPRPLAYQLLRMARFTGRHNHDFLHFGVEASLIDLVAPAFGERRLEDYFLEQGNAGPNSA